METLHLHRKNSGSYPTWLWYPADHQSQLIALMHFSGGSCAISNECLDEVIYVAGLHGWKVVTESEDESRVNDLAHPREKGQANE